MEWENTECEDLHITLIDFVVKRCFITRLRMDRQEQLFCSLRKLNSYVLTLVTFTSEDAQEIYYNIARREARKDYSCFPGTSEWEQKEKSELSIGALKYTI